MASASGLGGLPALFAAASTPFAWKSPCRASAVRTPGSNAPGSIPAARAESRRAPFSPPIKSNAKRIRPLHHPVGGRPKRGGSGPFWLAISIGRYWLVRFPGLGASSFTAHQLHDEQTHNPRKTLHQAHV